MSKEDKDNQLTIEDKNGNIFQYSMT
jgi:hypothetical protein